MLTEDEAIQRAEKTLRFEIGNLPHLTGPRYSEDTSSYVFAIRISYPRLPDESDGEVDFDAPEMVGELIVDAEDESVSHTPLDVLSARVAEIKSRDEDDRRTR